MQVKALVVEEEVYQNQRYIPLIGWTSAYMLPADRKQFSTLEGAMSSESFPEVRLAGLTPRARWVTLRARGVTKSDRTQPEWLFPLEGADWPGGCLTRPAGYFTPWGATSCRETAPFACF